MIEDFLRFQVLLTQEIKEVFGSKVEVIVAGSLEKADELYNTHKEDIDLILMDTSLGNGVTTFALTKKISEEFNRPIISISTKPEYREIMMKYGCTHDCPKDEVKKFLLDSKVQLETWRDQH